MNGNNNNGGFVPAMPDGTPAPFVMIEQDLIRFARLDTKLTNGEDPQVDPHNTIAYYIEKGYLKTRHIGKRAFFILPDVIEFLQSRRSKPK